MSDYTAEEIAAERARRAGGSTQPAQGEGSTTYSPDDIQAEQIRRAVEARKGAGNVAGAWSDFNDSGRLFANGILPFGVADRIAAGMNTAIGNVGSSIKIFDEPLMEDPNIRDEFAKQRLESDKAAARVDEGIHPWASEAIGTAGLLTGPAKAALVKPAISAVGKAAKFGGQAGLAYGASQLLDEPLAAYGGYKMIDALKSRLFGK